MKQPPVVSDHATVLVSCLLVLALHLISATVGASHSNSNSVDVQVDLSRVNRTVHSDFLSVTIDAGAIHSNWHGVDLKMPRLINMAKALAPCTLRVGGTSGDFILYSVSGSSSSWRNDSVQVDGLQSQRHSNHESSSRLKLTSGIMDHENFTMTAAAWDSINGFVSDVGWSFVFGLNVLLRSPWPVGSWYPDNAVSLMEYTHTRGYQVDWELGNEPDLLYEVEPKIPITPSELASDFKQLKTLMPKYSPQTKRIIGPDVATLTRHDFFKLFLDSIGTGVLDAITWHHYYANGQTTSLPDFYDVALLDKFINQSLNVVSLVESILHSSEVWVGETASTYDSGTPNVSDSYAAGFMWLDKLGVAAISGQKKLCRQDLFGGNYGLLNATIYPNPDYWLSVIHKRLVGTKVLYVTNSLTSGRSLRVYAHCTREDSSVYARGSVVLIVLNVDSGSGELILQDPELGKSKRDKYWLTPDGDNLTSKEVRLNGVKLELKDGSELPPLLPVGESASETVSIPARSFGFYVFKDTNASACS